jgi:hypothetical protein
VNVYELREPDALGERSHPWLGTADDPTLRCLDLRAHPELIRTSLEDFLPFDRYPAVHTFYALLAWLNGPGSDLETNDCAFVGPAPAETPVGKRREATGRVMLLFRDLHRNTSAAAVQGLLQRVGGAVQEEDPAFAWGAVAVARVAVRFTGLPEGRQAGHQLLVSFWAWGDDDAEVMANLDRVFRNLTGALQRG